MASRVPAAFWAEAQAARHRTLASDQPRV